MALPPQQFCVRWNSYHTNLQSVFPRLLVTEQFADVTLACESKALRCHKLVLSACSAYLEKLLLQNPCKHPIVLMRDMRFSEMQALVDFMYKGEVNVTQDELPSLLKSAEALQIRGLCSSDTGGLTQELNKTDASFAVASDALVANASRDNINGPTPQQSNPTPSPQTNGNGNKKRKSTTPEVKEETVEEDGLYYGELDNEHMEYNEDDEPSKPGSSLGQTSDDFAISNVQCQYDSASDSEDRAMMPNDHNYGLRDEPPAFIIQSVAGSAYVSSPGSQPCMEVSPRVVLSPNVRLLPIRDNSNYQQSQSDNNINKRIRRSEVELSRAADCVSRGSTFQTVSEQFNIPISTIRFFMARKGILPRRRRGRTSAILSSRQSSSPEPPYHMQHYKLPEMIALKDDDDDD